MESETEKPFVVYQVVCRNMIVYIGCGKKGRESHCTSGASGSYGLNALHFSGFAVKVEIVGYFTSKEDALLTEIQLIKTKCPLLNITDNPESKKQNGLAKLYDILYQQDMEDLQRLKRNLGIDS